MPLGKGGKGIKIGKKKVKSFKAAQKAAAGKGIKNTGAYVASIEDKIKGKGWRKKARRKKKS
jgi:hypothetical protein